MEEEEREEEDETKQTARAVIYSATTNTYRVTHYQETI